MLMEPLRPLDREMPTRLVPPAPQRHPVADAVHPSLSYLLAAHDARAGVIESLLQGLPVGIVLLDASGHERWTNAAARTLAAWEAPAVQRAAAQVLATGTERREEALEHRAAPGGPRRWLDLTAVPVRNGAGTTRAVLVTIVDATARVQATDWRPIIDTLVRL